MCRCTTHPTFSSHRVWCVSPPFTTGLAMMVAAAVAHGSHHCVCTGPARAPLQVYAENYTLSGCSHAAYCGVFHRVVAHCARCMNRCDEYYHCPNNPTLCDAAPVYQREWESDGSNSGYAPVLYRRSSSETGVSWWDVGLSSRLGDCGVQGIAPRYITLYHSAGSNAQPSSPDAAVYGWSHSGGYGCHPELDNVNCNDEGTIHIVAGDGSGH